MVHGDEFVDTPRSNMLSGTDLEPIA